MSIAPGYPVNVVGPTATNFLLGFVTDVTPFSPWTGTEPAGSCV